MEGDDGVGSGRVLIRIPNRSRALEAEESKDQGIQAFRHSVEETLAASLADSCLDALMR